MVALQDRVLAVFHAGCGGVLETQVRLDWLDRPGRAECGTRWPLVSAIYAALVEDGELPETMPPREWRRVDGVLTLAGRAPQIVEVDEVQHFNRFRAATLAHYPDDIALGFPKVVWRRVSETKKRLEGGGFAVPRPPLFPMPGGRHRQRALRDALADLLPAVNGFGPTIRIGDFEVEGWIWADDAVLRLRDLVVDRLDDPGPASPEAGLPVPAPGDDSSGARRAAPARPPLGGSTTQRITAADLQAGRIRLPADTKAFFPTARALVEIVLRGERLTVRYDPRTGPDRARSAVLSIGKSTLGRLVAEDEALTVGSRDGVVRLD